MGNPRFGSSCNRVDLLTNCFFFRDAQADLEFGIPSGLVPIGIMCAKILENTKFGIFLTFQLGIWRWEDEKWGKAGNVSVLKPCMAEKSSKKSIEKSKFSFSTILAHMIPIDTSPDRIPNSRSA